MISSAVESSTASSSGKPSGARAPTAGNEADLASIAELLGVAR